MTTSPSPNLRPRNQRGFTLIEMMLVVAIIAIITGIALPSAMNSLKKTRGGKSAANLKQLQLGMDMWETDNGAPWDPATGARAQQESSTLTIDPATCNTATATGYGNSTSGGSAGFAAAVANNIKVTSSLWTSPQAANTNDPQYRYKVFSTTDNSGGEAVITLTGEVWSALNGLPQWEPKLTTQDVTSGSSDPLFTNGFEDQGRLGPNGEKLGAGYQ